MGRTLLGAGVRLAVADAEVQAGQHHVERLHQAVLSKRRIGKGREFERVRKVDVEPHTARAFKPPPADAWILCRKG